MSRFFLVVAVLGIAVLASYVQGVASHPDLVARQVLWGTMSDGLRKAYVGWMFVAAAGFFPAFVHFVSHPEARVLGGSQSVALGLYVLVLVPSALWMSLAFGYFESPSSFRYWLMRLDLLLVAVGSLALLFAIATVEPAPSPGVRALAIAGQAAFCVQTVLLDCLIWPGLVRVH